MDNALTIIRDAFPDRKVVGVSGTMLAEGGGVHCITQHKSRQFSQASQAIAF